MAPLHVATQTVQRELPKQEIWMYSPWVCAVPFHCGVAELPTRHQSCFLWKELPTHTVPQPSQGHLQPPWEELETPSTSLIWPSEGRGSRPDTFPGVGQRVTLWDVTASMLKSQWIVMLLKWMGPSPTPYLHQYIHTYIHIGAHKDPFRIFHDKMTQL